MEKLIFKPQKDTPKVILDKENNIFEIAGASFSVNTPAFYRPILEWIDIFAKSPNPQIKFVLKLRIINSSSIKMILDILFKLNEIYNNGTDILILWRYKKESDNDILEVGKDFADVIKIPFKFESYK